SILLILALAACAGASSESEPPPSPAPSPPAPQPEPEPPQVAAPWAGERLASSAVPSMLLTEWREADNRETCAPLAPASLGEWEAATPRAATFSGGWAVAWDLPEARSAFGVAGTGVDASEPAYSEWPYHLEWSDGSSAEYGLEGGTGENWLAYLRVNGQDCLYNVWSHVSREHLESLLAQLRYVDTE
ncbi:MAG: hypothetical protein ACREKM_05470, partial [Longimicrobiales bacterium]